MKSEATGVSLLAASNLSLSSIGEFFMRLEPMLHAVFTIAQAAVAVVTVIYILKKIGGSKKPVSRKRKK